MTERFGWIVFLSLFAIAALIFLWDLGVWR